MNTKLVRNRIPQIIWESLLAEGKTKPAALKAMAEQVTFRIEADQEEIEDFLRLKLQEEVGEYLAAERGRERDSELVDIIEVCFALADIGESIGRADLLSLVENKRKHNGGFSAGIIATFKKPKER